MKKLIFIFTTVALTMLTSCATILVSSEPSSNTSTKIKSSKVVAEDQLYAVGRIENETILKEYPSSVAMVGRNAIYVLVKGGDRIAEISKILDGARLFSADDKGRKATTEIPFEIGVKNGKFSGGRRFFYDKPKSELTEDETAMIKKSPAYSIGEQGSTFTVDFAGFIPQVPVELKSEPLSFKIERKVVLRETELEQTTLPNLEKYMLMPFAIAFDIVTLPLQAVFFAALVGGHN